jgi:hypothetical protein
VFSVVVSEVDLPPVFKVHETVAVKPLKEVIIPVSARDPDSPSVAVQYSIAPSQSAITSNATIDKVTGRLVWIPPPMNSSI